MDGGRLMATKRNNNYNKNINVTKKSNKQKTEMGRKKIYGDFKQRQVKSHQRKLRHGKK